MNKTFDLDGLLLRHIKVEEFEKLEEIASTVQFDIGIHNWHVYYSVSPNDFWVFVEPKENKIVGLFTGNGINEEFFLGHLMILLPEYRKKSTFRRAGPIFVGSHAHFATNRNATSIFAFRHDPIYFGHKLIGFYGKINHQKHWLVIPPKNVSIVTLQ